jgi:hypothetical protein
MSTARTLASSFALVLLALAAPRASATIHRDTSAGGACQAAAGGSTAFTFGNTYLLNKGTTAQYVICHFAQLDFDNDHQPPERLDVYFTAGLSADTISCVVQMGYFYNGAVITSAWQTRTATADATTSGALTWLAADLPRTAAAYTLTLNCKVPAGFKLGLIGLREPNPTSGNGWVP